ncbi:hypothetical protein GQ457_10G012330 [Hibiscus cannabinus]
MERNNNNGHPPADGQDLPAHADGAIVPPVTADPASGAIVPPIPQNNQQPVKTIHDYLVEDLEGLNPAITILEFEAEHFELKLVIFNMLNTLGQFGRSPVENARQHLKSFLEICNSFKIHGVSNDVLNLKLFPYSLRDKAKAWLNNLPPVSFQSWIELNRCFLAKFSYNNMIDNLRNQITSFRQEDDKAMHEAWERCRELFRRCPMHGLPEWTLVAVMWSLKLLLLRASIHCCQVIVFKISIPQDDKGDVSNRDNGSCQADISAGLQISAERLAVFLAYP